jgi:hypothetical protein
MVADTPHFVPAFASQKGETRSQDRSTGPGPRFRGGNDTRCLHGWRTPCPGCSAMCSRTLSARALVRRSGGHGTRQRITDKAKSNLSGTLRTIENHGLVRLERGERGRITPRVVHDCVELGLPLALP